MADGSLLAVCLHAGIFRSGKIQVCLYNEKKGDWSQKGNDISIKIGTISPDNLKFNSGGNQRIVSGLNEDVDIESHSCVVQSFLYIEITDEWVTQ